MIRAIRLRPLLILGRVSNLPTVWSNCLAAWLLGGGGSDRRLAQLLLGATLLYTGGMFLNDAVDVAFDRQYRTERPIPSGQISRSAVCAWAAALLGLGWMTLWPLGITAVLYASVLLAAIVLYDLLHKQTDLAPLLMAACRFFLYLLAATAAQERHTAAALVPALALAAYVAGLSYLARGESRRPLRGLGPWPLTLLTIPVAIAITKVPSSGWDHLVLVVLTSAWILWCLRYGFVSAKPDFSRGVSGLLAGIVLVDALAAPGSDPICWAFFAGLFALALLLQRVIPAT